MIRAKVPEGVRPTPSMVREALFNILGQELGGLSFLDGFAGMGMIGLEALSRGAGPVVFLERSPKVAAMIRETGAQLGLALDVRVGEIPKAFPKQSFDLVFLDPPYALDPAPFVAAAPGRRVVLEHLKSRPAPEVQAFELESRRIYGDTALAFYRRLSDLPVDPDGDRSS